MKKLKFALLLTLLSHLTYGQLVNDGATITIKNGATLFVESDVQNNTTGTITVDQGGTLEVQGNYTNSGTSNLDVNGTLKFSGSAVASTITINPGTTHSIDALVLNKTGVNRDLTLGSDIQVDSSLTLTSNDIILGVNDLILGTGVSAISGGSSTSYIQANLAGVVQKNVNSSAAFNFPVGDASVYSPLSSTRSGTYGGGANIKVNISKYADGLGHPNKPAAAESFLERTWNVDQTGITGYSNLLVGTYDPADVNGTEAFIKGAVYDGTEWSYSGAARSGLTVSGTTNDAMADFTGTNFYGKVNLKAFLSGNYNTGTNLMNTTLNLTTGVNILGKFAVNSPYTDAAANVIDSAFFPTHPTIVDWIKLEVFPSTQPNGSFATSSAIAKVSALLLSNGSIVSPVDASSPVVIENADVNSKIKIVHRNHLPTRTDAAIPTDSNSPALVDFSTGSSVFYNNGAGSNPMNLFNTTFNALWQSNVNSIKTSDAGPLSANVDLQINAADLGLEKSNTTTSASNVYSIFDLNLDRNKNAADFGIAKAATTTTKVADL